MIFSFFRSDPRLCQRISSPKALLNKGFIKNTKFSLVETSRTIKRNEKCWQSDPETLIKI